mmetsp:Transcript_23324/g.55072  ORF Transcript_23324/g.55072 Transcript_23324/m.55072 type:complete len:372 (-) Transcript_23324:64-1179(-)
MAELRGRVDELQSHLLQGLPSDLGQERLAHGDQALARAHDGALQHDPILAHLAVVAEAAHGGNGLLGQVILSARVVGVILQRLADAVDLLVDLGSMVVTSLTGARHLECHACRMPGANAGHLSQSAVCLPGQTSDAPASDHAIEAFALGGTDDVNHLILGENVLHLDLLLEKAHGEVHLVGSASSVDLDLLDVGFLLTDSDFPHLRVADRADHLAVLLGPLHLSAHGIFSVLGGLLPSLLILGERLLLRGVPSLVEAPLALLREVSRPDRGERPKASGGLNISDEANNDHGGTLEHAHRLDDLFLVELGARSVDLPNDVRHASLVAHEGCQMRLLGGIILGEALDLAVVVPGALAGQEAQRAMSGTLKLSV